MENLLAEAFQRLSLLEQDFDFSTVDKDKVDELSAFIADDVDEIPEEPIIDLNAEDEEDLADNYIGKVILECECCHTRIYKNEEDVVIDDEAGLANVDEACPVCNNSLGYSVIGKIEAFDSERVIEPEDNEEDIPEDEAPEEVEDDVEVEDEEEEKDESLKNSKVASEDSKKLSEGKLPLHDRLARKHLDSLTSDDITEAAEDDDFTNDFIGKDAYLNLQSNSASDYGMTEEEYDELVDRDGDHCIITACDCFANPEAKGDNKFKDQYWTVKFDDGHGLEAISGYELDLRGIGEKLNDEEAARMAEITKNGVVKAADRNEYKDLRDKEKVDEELLDHGNDNLEASDELATKDTQSLEDDQTELVHAADEKIEAINEACEDDVCPECGKNPCACKGDLDEAADRHHDNKFDSDFDDALDNMTPEEEEKIKKASQEANDFYHSMDKEKAEFDEAFPDDLPDPWGGNKVKEACDESLTESVEVHTDGEPVDLVKNDDGSLSIEVGGEEAADDFEVEEPIADVPAEGEEIVPLDAEDQAAIEANEPEAEDEFADLGGDEFAAEDEFAEPAEDEFAAEEEEEEEPFESLEDSGKPAINESAKGGDTIQDKIAKEELKQAKIETKMMQLDLAARQAEAEAAAPIEEVPVEDEETPAEDEVVDTVEDEVIDDAEIEADESLDQHIGTNILETIDNVDEAKFDAVCENFLRRVYGNVDSFKTSKVSMSNKEAFIEGVINFTSGKSKSTTFSFANPEITKRGKLVMEGFNKTFSDSPKAFKLKSVVDGTNMVAESMIYSFTSKQLNESNEQEVVRVYGRVKA